MRAPRIGVALVVLVSAVAAAAPEPELYRSVTTKQSRADISAFLVAPAERAAKARDWARAIPLYEALAVARGPGSAEQKQLATLWTLAGQNAEAADAWSTFAASATDNKDRAEAQAEAQRLAASPDPF